MRYRKEIDGLRAVAVIPVVLFHAGVSWFSGGFVGVDVFFVISGFLITSILIEELQTQRFSLVGFYERRARRILPALFLTLLVSLPFAFWLLSPRDLNDFMQSLIAIVLFGSNMLFWAESGYFDAAAELKPMLHTWSLAVEEQYYVIFPLLLLAAWRWGWKAVFWLISVIAAVSLGVSEWQAREAPAAAFFLLPSRAWELFLGGLGALVLIRSARLQGLLDGQRGLCEILSVAGLVMILWAIFRFDEQMAFPGINALVPVLGTFLILVFGKDTRVGQMLGQAPLVMIGLVSYSAYLFHQPIFAFARHAAAAEIHLWVMLILSVVTFALAYLSWRYVEQPFRKRSQVGQTAIFVGSAAGIAAFLVVGLVGTVNRDWVTNIRLAAAPAEARATFRYPSDLFEQRVAMVQSFRDVATSQFKSDPETTKILIIGDSVAADLFIGLMLQSDRLPGLQFRRARLDDRCMMAAANVLLGSLSANQDAADCGEDIGSLASDDRLTEADVVVLNAHWRQRPNDRPDSGAIALAEVLADRGKTVAMVGLLSIKEGPSIDFLAMTKGMTRPEANKYTYRTLRWNAIGEPNEAVRRFSESQPNVHYLDKLALFCDDESEECTLYDSEGNLLFGDDVHVTVAGAVYFARRAIDQGWLTGLLQERD
jgi:peptidoglycan/LPS O-acetylase OafA/YrhL